MVPPERQKARRFGANALGGAIGCGSLPAMHRPRVDGRGVVVAVLTALVAMAALAGTATAATTVRPRIGMVLGIEPAHGAQPVEIASGQNFPVVYHGGSVMRDVTIHTVFWAPSGYHFDAAPSAGTLGYQALIQQFFTDVAHDSGSTGNLFSLLDQYGDRSGVGSYDIHYSAAVDSVTDTDPYPSAARQCASPSDVATCVTDLQLQQEIDRLIGPSDSTARGLSNIWFIFLPPDVDTCTSPGTCGTTAYAGYHSAFDLGHGVTVYAAIPDPLIEFTPPPGSDPEGNPEAEETIDTLGHETMEAMTNPLGNAWMDPNGFETADKCENGPEVGTPLGYASDGSPYNQLINGHMYLIQDIWSDSRDGCVQSSTASAAAPALHTVDLRQFSPSVSGDLGVAGRVPVTVILLRSFVPVALGSTESRGDGSWGPVTLRGPGGEPHAVGDDRDTIEVLYGLSGSAPSPDFIQTGDGGNPFTESGWTGWFDLDHGYAVHDPTAGSGAVLVGPCGQTGLLSLRIGARLAPSPVDLCETESDAAIIDTAHIGAGTPVTMTSEDNRGSYQLEPGGALVKMTIGLGEPDSISSVANNQLLYVPTGFPTCTAFLRIRTVRCAGLVAGTRYRLLRRGATIGRGRAGQAGGLTVSGLSVKGGDVITLVNGAGRHLTSLHVAHLRVNIIGNETQVASGTCQAGDYWGPPVSKPPTSGGIGEGIAGNGTICPLDGRAKGLSTADIAQTDDFSGGQTETQVPLIESTSPIQDETLYGPFVASAQSGLPGPHGAVSSGGVPVGLTIAPAGSPHHAVFHARNVDTAAGVDVPALDPGAYVATWILRDAAGDTRTVTTRFTDET
jgi:hypothetical protein